MTEENVYLNVKHLESVVGGEGGLGTCDIRDLLPGQDYCSYCDKIVYTTTNANGESCCPDCGRVLYTYPANPNYS